MQHRLDSETDQIGDGEHRYVISSPSQVPARYRDALLKVIAAFYDSELAASASFTHLIQFAPNIEQYINVARLIAEKAEHSKVILQLLAAFGEHEPEYCRRLQINGRFNWSQCLDRHDDLSLRANMSDDQRVAVLFYPTENWLDGVVMYVLLETAAQILIVELGNIFYRPMSHICQMVMTSERQRAFSSAAELEKLVKNAHQNGSIAEVELRFAYWLQRVRANFEPCNLPYFERLRALGLPHRSNQEMLNEFNLKVKDLRLELQLD